MSNLSNKEQKQLFSAAFAVIGVSKTLMDELLADKKTAKHFKNAKLSKVQFVKENHLYCYLNGEKMSLRIDINFNDTECEPKLTRTMLMSS